MTALNQPWRQLDRDRRRQKARHAVILSIYFLAGICLGIGIGALLFAP